MSDIVARYAKGIIAMVSAVATLLAVHVPVEPAMIETLIIALLGAFGVILVPNKPKTP